MRTQYIIYEYRAIADLVQLKHGYLITRINVPKQFRNKGIGSQLLKRVLAEADLNNVTLYLQIQPSDGLTFNQLKAWYKRYGFRGMKASDVAYDPTLYIRNPNVQTEAQSTHHVL